MACSLQWNNGTCRHACLRAENTCTAGLDAVSHDVDVLGNDVTLSQPCEKEDNSIVPPAEAIRRRWGSSRLVAMAVRVLDYMYYSTCRLTDAPLSTGALSAACHTMNCRRQRTLGQHAKYDARCCILRRCMMGFIRRARDSAAASRPSHRIAAHRTPASERWKGPRSTRASPPELARVHTRRQG
jgi:hypothetical protein